MNKEAHNFLRDMLPSAINNYQIHFWAINAVLMRFEAKKKYKFNFKMGVP